MLCNIEKLKNYKEVYVLRKKKIKNMNMHRNIIKYSINKLYKTRQISTLKYYRLSTAGFSYAFFHKIAQFFC